MRFDRQSSKGLSFRASGNMKVKHRKPNQGRVPMETKLQQILTDAAWQPFYIDFFSPENKSHYQISNQPGSLWHLQRPSIWVSKLQY